MNIIGGALSGLGRILRPQQGQPPPRPMDEIPRPYAPPDVEVSPEFDNSRVSPSRIKRAATDTGAQPMPNRLPSVSAPQPEDAATARIARGVGINTEPAVSPHPGFDQAMRRAQGAPAPMPEEFKSAEGPQPLNSTGQAIEPAQRIVRDSSAQSTTQPPAPPQLRQVRASTPMPVGVKHGEKGDSNRAVHALKAAGKEFIMSGLNPMAAAGAGAATLIDPQGYHDVQHQKDINRWWSTAHAEMQAQEEENKGKIQQQQMDTGYYDRIAKEEELTARRGERKTAADDRAIKIKTDREDRLHSQTKDYVDEMVKTGQRIDPEMVKGTKFAGVGGRTLTTQQRDHLFHTTDAKTGEESIYNYDTGERQVIPGVTGRIQREPREPGPSEDTLTNRALADKEQFENYKQIQLPKARSRQQELERIAAALDKGDDVSISGLSPEAQAILSAVSGGSREDKVARVKAEAQKAKEDATALQERMHTHLADSKTKYAKYPGLWEFGGKGDDPYVKVHPEAAAGTGKRTGLLDTPSRIRPPAKR